MVRSARSAGRNSPDRSDSATLATEARRGETWSLSSWRDRRSGTGPAGMNAFELVEDLIKAQARDELHDVVVQAVLFADAEDRDDVGVVQPGGRPGLALEALLLAAVDQETAAAAP